MDLKEQANKLIKIAEKIEKEASEYTFFICANCNHTASLSDINNRRTKIASQENSEMTVKPVTINDTVSCPVDGCEGNMNYVATDDSEKYYVEAGKDDADPIDAPEDKPKADTDKKEDTGDIDKEIDDLFEDVETQNAKSKEEKKDKTETIQKARKEKKEKDDVADLLEESDKEKSETPKEDDPFKEPAKDKDKEPATVKKEDKPEEGVHI